MKHFMLPKSTILRDNNPSTNLTDNSNTSSPSSSPNHTLSKHRSVRKHKSLKENSPPPHPPPDISPSVAAKSSPAAGKLRSPLPPRPPKRKLNVDAMVDKGGGGGAVGCSDTGVKVIVRMRPLNKDEEEGDLIVQKSSSDSLSIVGQTFTFDSVADVKSTQLDIFQLVGAPLVENCLAGFNSSVFAYGQTGSGKTYTIWGPANAFLEENLSSEQQGLTPRVFERLFSRIEEEQTKHTDKQLRYQCRCSFLEIYNEQITDLLEPSQRNLQIREDVKTGVYVENLREECVCTMKDVTQLLTKGLSNRRTGATSINSESSRSHSVFTCVVESRCKGLVDGLSCFKSSRINLVDLAGSERQKLTRAAGERLKEAGNINRSLSQLGNLINILAEVSQTGKQRHIPYRDSKLTFLLQESLGGNAKLAMVCAISPSQRCKSETFSTLRFAQRAKAIRNKAVINEEMQNDVNVLREMIKQLKDELLRVKENGNQPEPNGGYSTGWNARRSLNLLKFSLNRPLILPHADDDGDEEMEIVDHAAQISALQAGIEENKSTDDKELERVQLVESIDEQSNLSVTVSEEKNLVDGNKNLEAAESKKGAGVSHQITSDIDRIEEWGSYSKDVNMKEKNTQQLDNYDSLSIRCGESGTNIPSCSNSEVQYCKVQNSEEKLTNLVSITEKSISRQLSPDCISRSACNFLNLEILRKSGNDIPSCSPSKVSADIAVEAGIYPSNGLGDCADPSSLSLMTSEVSPVLKSPTRSVSPRRNGSRRSLRTSSTLAASQNDLRDLTPETVHLSYSKPLKSKGLNAQSTEACKHVNGPNEDLAASLQRGLEVLDRHHQSSGLRRSSFRFSYRPADYKPVKKVHKVDVGVQTLVLDDEAVEADPMISWCSKCKTRKSQELRDANECTSLQVVAVENGSQSAEKSMKLVPKAVEKVLGGAIRREMALEEYCAKQNSEILQLNRVIQQYKHERDCNAKIGQTLEDKIVRLESLMDGILSGEDFVADELVSLKDENKILRAGYENHPEVLSTKIELKRVQDELERYRNFYHMGERDVLVEEIQDLRSQLQCYTDASPKSIMNRCSLLQLTYPCEPSTVPSLCPIPESTGESAECRLEMERIQWTEAESKWISLTEELRAELEASRMLAEKQRTELNMEKKCSEELKVSMQMAMEGHARMIEQYADLQEKHVELLDQHRRIRDGIEDVKKAAAKAGVRGAESKFINTLAAEISALKVEREKERRYLMDENKGLQAQLRDTAEAVQAAGELLVRLKEAEEAVAAAQKQAAEADAETARAYKQIDKLKRKHEKEVSTLNQLLAQSCRHKGSTAAVYDDSNTAKCDAWEPDNTAVNQQQGDEFEQPLYTVEEVHISTLPEPSSWFSGYDRCNV